MTTELKETIKSAKKHNNCLDLVAVVCEHKLSKKSKKVFYGFHFEKIGAVKVNDIQILEDMSIRKVIYVF